MADTKVRIIKANHMLQSKIGSGEVDASQISVMQKIMDTTTTDFVPLATPFLDELAAALETAKMNKSNSTALINAMIVPVMQIKANGGMFHYELVTTLARLVLHFLENIDTLDKAALDIVEAHYKTLSLIINNKISGMGGDYGAQLEQELKEACNRYYKKKIHTIPVTAQIADLDSL